MKSCQFVVLGFAGVLLAGCAGSVSEPVAVQPLSTEQRAGLHISDVTADAADGVQMSDGDFGLICQRVKADLEANSPGITSAAAGSAAYKMKLHFTKFDRGNAFARAMLAGLGQIRIEATVDLVDDAGKSVAEYKVAKDFSFGGVAGATTTVEDVEDGFAKSVAEIAKAKG